MSSASVSSGAADNSAIEPRSTVDLGRQAPWALESVPCVSCGHGVFQTVFTEVIDRIFWKPGEAQLQSCTRCGLVQTRPRPTKSSLAAVYEGVYDTPEAREGLHRFYTGPIGRLVNFYRLATIEKVHRLTDADHVLDVGCSYGHWLASARAARGCAATGLDTDQASLDSAMDAHEIDYHYGVLTDLSPDVIPPSVITFYQCLEHDLDPVGTLAAARERVAPGGLVVVEVPTWGTLWQRVFGKHWHPLFAPQHLVHFSPHHLDAVVRQAGLVPVHHQPMVFPSEQALSLRSALLGALLPVGWRPWPWLDALLVPIVVASFWLVDVPVQFLLRTLFSLTGTAGWTGHQTLIARRPLKDAPTDPSPGMTDSTGT